MQYTSSVFNADGRAVTVDTDRPDWHNTTDRQRSSQYRLTLFRELVSEGYLLYHQWGPSTGQRAYHMPRVPGDKGKRTPMTPEHGYALHCKGMIVSWIKREKVEQTLTLKGRTFNCLKVC